jgi:hypothetical protein
MVGATRPVARKQWTGNEAPRRGRPSEAPPSRAETWPREARPDKRPFMAPEAKQAAPKLWKPHPDDQADVREALASLELGELLSVQASEAFLRWLEGADDESWRAEFR